jgi:iron complex outermembrane receptor protein
MGGVLHFIDERTAAVNTTEADISAGFNSNTFGSTTDVGIRSATEHVNWSLRAGLNNHSDYYDANFDRVANSRFREFTGKATMGLNYKRSVTLFSYQLNMGDYGIVEPFEKNNPAETEDHPMEFETPYHTLVHHTASVKNTLLLGQTSVITTASYQNDQRKELEPGDTESNPFLGFNLNVVSLDIKADHHFSEKVSLVTGVNGVYQNNTNNGYSRLIPDYSQLDLSAYAWNRYSLLDQKLVLDIGARYDHRSINSQTSGQKDSADYMPSTSKMYENLSASFGMNYRFRKTWYVYANAGTGYRAPNMAELTSNGVRLETQRYEIGNVGFLKETNMQEEIGIRSEHAQYDVDASLFYNRIGNYIFITRTTDTLQGKPVYRFQQADALIWGGEARLNIHPATFQHLNFMTAYSALKGTEINGSYLPLMPQNKWTSEITLRGNISRKITNTFIRLSYTYVFAQDNTADNELKTPFYQLVNLAMGGDMHWLRQKFNISFGVNNLFNEAYYDHLSRLRPYGVYNMGLNAFFNVKVPLLWEHKRS